MSSAPLSNIDARGIAARRRMGFAALGVGLVAVPGLALAGGSWATLAAFPFFWAAGLGFFQARAKTWVRLAARGSRDVGRGPEPVTEAEEREALRRQARLVHVQALTTGVVLTAIGAILAARLG